MVMMIIVTVMMMVMMMRLDSCLHLDKQVCVSHHIYNIALMFSSLLKTLTENMKGLCYSTDYEIQTEMDPVITIIITLCINGSSPSDRCGNSGAEDSQTNAISFCDHMVK